MRLAWRGVVGVALAFLAAGCTPKAWMILGAGEGLAREGSPGSFPTFGPSVASSSEGWGRLGGLPRSLVDRPDDHPGFQVHVVYLLPSDAPDEEADSNGAIARMLELGRAWMRQESGGTHLRIDTQRGEPDLSFLRSRLSTAAFGKTASAIRKQAEAELRAAGFEHPQKLYTILYGGDSLDREDPTTTGLSSGAYHAVFFKQCNPCVGSVARRELGLKTALTVLHEAFHGLGAVAEGAPHRNGAHTSDAEEDLMSASGESKRLDVGRDDYFGHGREDLLDLARSPFMEPMPARVVGPDWAPWFREPEGAGHVAIAPPPVSEGDRLRLLAITAAPGPWGSLSLAFRVALDPSAEPASGHVAVDGTRAMAYRLAPGGSTWLLASVPGQGRHRLTLGVATDEAGREVHDHSFEVEAEAELGKVLVGLGPLVP